MKFLSLPLLLVFLCFFPVLSLKAQEYKTYQEELEAYQASQNETFKDPETTILKKEDLLRFKGLEFYPINEVFRVKARFVRTPDEKPFLMFTSTFDTDKYVKYGEVHFSISGKKLKLNVYQNVPRDTNPRLKDYLFLPFTDLTSGDGSYGGGRYIDTYIPEGNTIVIDFNKAYNPYCAYNEKYSCPIPPRENDLQIRVEAGVKDFGEH